MTRKATGGAVDTHLQDIGDMADNPAVRTFDSIDNCELSAIQHPDGDVAVYIMAPDGDQAGEVVMGRQQAREFFTQALKLC